MMIYGAGPRSYFRLGRAGRVYHDFGAVFRNQGLRSFASSTRRREIHTPLSVKGPLDCALLGTSLLRSPYFNKGSAFSPEERRDFEIDDLLPSNIGSLDAQIKRAYRQYASRTEPLAKNTFLASMKDQNEVLYYALVQKHIKEMFSVIYTPTQGEAIQRFSEIFRRPAGCFLDIEKPENVDSALSKWGTSEDIDLILVTDGEAILGIGDQGVGGILISSAKLAVYTLCAGIHPHRVLPVVLDVGTNNETLLNDELYLGLRRSRVRGQRYDDFVDSFVQATRRHFPKALLHFEDFGLNNAARLLERYREDIPVFNDDIQGTGCTALAALKAAAKVCDINLHEMRIVCFGAGSAGMGNAMQIAKGVAVEGAMSMEEARKHIWCIDRPGVLLESHGDKLTPAQRSFAREDSEWEGKDHQDLTSIIREVKPHVLIGCSTKGGAFTEDAIREMAKHVDRPIVCPLSNPAQLSEADPGDINAWTNGKALIATGSPFPPVEWEGVKYTVAQCNNSTIFPAIGLGSILSRSRLVTDEMLVAATEALASHSPALADPNDGLLPDVTIVRELSVSIAMAVIKTAVEQGLNDEKAIPSNDADLETWVREQMWNAEYRPLRRVGVETADKHAKGQTGMQGTRHAL